MLSNQELLTPVITLCRKDLTRNKAIEQAYFRIVNQFLAMLNDYTEKPLQTAIQLDYRKIEKYGHRTLNKLLHPIFNIELISQSNGKYLIAYGMNEDVLEVDTMPHFTAILRLIYRLTEDQHNEFSVEDSLQITHYVSELSLTESSWLFEKPKPKVTIHYADGLIE